MKSSRQVALDVLLEIQDDAAWEEVAAQLLKARSMVLAHASSLIVREIWQTNRTAGKRASDVCAGLAESDREDVE